MNADVRRIADVRWERLPPAYPLTASVASPYAAWPSGEGIDWMWM